jgi:anti-sigma-K factor RskA
MMKHDNPKLIDALAAEYVLGTLTGRARRRFERWRAHEWHVERRVQAWEERLSGLALRLPPMRPSPHVWSQIEKRIGANAGAGSRTTQPPPRARAPWGAIAAAVALFVVVFGGYLGLRLMQPPELHEMATLAAQNAQPSWYLSADDDLSHLRARAGEGAVAQTGKSYELWALPDNGAAPVSLGLMPVAGEIDRELTEAQRAALRGASKVAISLEPQGGSTTGAPTGPVVMVADRIKRA